MLVGQFIFRETKQPSHRENHKIMMVCGLIAVPNDFRAKGEHQYVITGHGKNNPDSILVHFQTEKNLTDQLKGLTASGIFTSPIWRI